jgi:pantoate--beta-alanine ligase
MQAVSSKIIPVLHPTIASFRALRKTLQPSLKIGFVPTMGALHEGHLSLVKEARESNDIVVVSIFVNPTQFGKGEDFEKYPRQLERDSDLLGEYGVVRNLLKLACLVLQQTILSSVASLKDHLFAPAIEDMYRKNHATFVEPEGFDDIPEGRSRPGHFRGVATIVTKLFNIVQPTNAYFGQKDAAQCSLIRRIVEDLDMDLHVVVRDTIREGDGLAMSSRNAYLSSEERKAAPIIFKALRTAKEQYLANPSISSDTIAHTVNSILKTEPLIGEIHYVSVDNKATMKPIKQVGEDGGVISLACRVGAVRLIDNIVL